MKLVSYRIRSESGVGVMLDDGQNIVDLTEAGLGHDMLSLIEGFADVREEIERAVVEETPLRPVRDLTITAPIPHPRRNIFCVGKNYHEHAAEFGASGFDAGASGGDEVPEHPIVFSKLASAVIGPGEAVDSSLDPHGSVDYEAEIAVVIGKRGRVSETDDPMSFVFGYTIINDITAREEQRQHKQWLLAKGSDTFCPMGPAILTADAVDDPAEIEIRCWVNNEARQSGTLAELIFNIPTLIREIGRTITLEPGDIIATGTPSGAGVGFTPPRFLKPGDRVRIEVPEIGTLENPVI